MTYVFDNAWESERARLTGLESGLDAGTIRHLENLGVGAGWRCWEIGGGGGSIAAWLCERVGDDGHVLATDLETTFLEGLPYANIVVRRHTSWPMTCPRGSSTSCMHAGYFTGSPPGRRSSHA